MSDEEKGPSSSQSKEVPALGTQPPHDGAEIPSNEGAGLIAEGTLGTPSGTSAGLDPFPEIYPSLLNSADLEDYVSATTMISPFSPEDLQSASYKVRLRGTCCYWDESRTYIETPINDGDELVLPKNGIVFFEPDTQFRLPDYIAARFNLTIHHVHKGLLLGTGPLIDPGFQGKLLIPLHNLTANEYRLKGGDSLIALEFTKLSPNSRWEPSHSKVPDKRRGMYREFPKDKKNLSRAYYFLKAVGQGGSIRSSIPEAMYEASLQAKEARKEAKDASSAASRVQAIAFGVSAVIVISAAAMYLTAFNFVRGYVADSRDKTALELAATKSKLERIQAENSQKIEALVKEIEMLKGNRESIDTPSQHKHKVSQK